MILVIFRRFLNFGPFFGPFLGTLVENSKNKKVAPGNPNIDIWVPKMRFSKMYIFGGPNWVRGACYGIFFICEKPALRAGLINELMFSFLKCWQYIWKLFGYWKHDNILDPDITDPGSQTDNQTQVPGVPVLKTVPCTWRGNVSTE